MTTQTTYARMNEQESNILYFMQRNRVDSVPLLVRENVIRLYRESTIEASRIPSDWWDFDCTLEN